MALEESTLKNNLLNVFKNMTDGDDSYFAKNVSAKIADYAQSGSISTTDMGAVPGGSYTGQGNGSITVQSSICEGIVLAACKAMAAMSSGGNAFLAAQLATGIDSMMSAGSVSTTVVGTLTPPPPATPIAPYGGSAKGSFSGVSSTLQGGFLAAFNAMENMTENGDEYLAGEIAKTVTSYLKAGSISTNGLVNIAGSSGSGSMS